MKHTGHFTVNCLMKVEIISFYLLVAFGNFTAR